VRSWLGREDIKGVRKVVEPRCFPSCGMYKGNCYCPCVREESVGLEHFESRKAEKGSAERCDCCVGRSVEDLCLSCHDGYQLYGQFSVLGSNVFNFLAFVWLAVYHSGLAWAAGMDVLLECSEGWV